MTQPPAPDDTRPRLALASLLRAHDALADYTALTHGDGLSGLGLPALDLALLAAAHTDPSLATASPDGTLRAALGLQAVAEAGYDAPVSQPLRDMVNEWTLDVLGEATSVIDQEDDDLLRERKFDALLALAAVHGWTPTPPPNGVPDIATLAIFTTPRGRLAFADLDGETISILGLVAGHDDAEVQVRLDAPEDSLTWAQALAQADVLDAAGGAHLPA